MYKSKYKIDEAKEINIEEYNIRFIYKNGKVYVDEDVKVKDIKSKVEFYKRVQPFTDDIIDLIENFNK